MGGMLDFISGAANAGAEIVGNRIAQAQKVDSEIDLQSRLTPIMAEREKAVGEERNRLALALNQGKIDQDIENAPKKAEAEAATKRTVGAAENEVLNTREQNASNIRVKEAQTKRQEELSFNQQNLKSLTTIERQLAQARHIESPAMLAQAEMARFNLQQAKEMVALQQGLAQAEADGNEKGIKAYKDQIEARGFTGKAKDVAPLMTAAAQSMKLAMDPMTPEADKPEHLARANALFKQAGIDTTQKKEKTADISSFDRNAKKDTTPAKPTGGGMINTPPKDQPSAPQSSSVGAPSAPSQEVMKSKRIESLKGQIQSADANIAASRRVNDPKKAAEWEVRRKAWQDMLDQLIGS